MRRGAVLCVAVAELLCLGAAAGAQTFSTGVRQVVAFVTARDQAGRLVGGLGREDFRVLDNGREVAIEVFDASRRPLHLVMLLDTSQSMLGSLQQLRNASAALIDALDPQDAVRISTFDGRVMLAPDFSSDKGQLRKWLPNRAGQNVTRLYDALVEGLGAFETGHLRRVVVVFSDGVDTASDVSRESALHALSDSNALLYAIGLRGTYQQGVLMAMRVPDPSLRSAAEETGGGYVELTQDEDLKASFEAIAVELRQQYVIGFTPPSSDGKVHSLQVRVKRPGMTARARRSYVAR